jgi:ribonuclease E
MLIDATHPEETRVVVLRGNRVEEFDFESAHRRQLRGNIYLAKVTRVEPSLQAAFVDYGGNRHGFLAFSEIHPDYYQIPVADRQALIDEEERAQRAADAEVERRASRRARPEGRAAARASRVVRSVSVAAEEPVAEAAEISAGEGATGDSSLSAEAAGAEPETTAEVTSAERAHEAVENPAGEDAGGEPPVTKESAAEQPAPSMAAEVEADREPDSTGPEPAAVDAAPAETAEEKAEFAEIRQDESEIESETRSAVEDKRAEAGDEENGAEEGEDEEIVESVGGTDALEEVPDRAPRMRRQYKIQEVIKRRQIMLVQVVKEERGTKGAALTTYLSLAGRYCVLMPNTARGGGISRKITNMQDRKRLKEIAQDLEVPEGMGVILRTAGAARTKTEIKRDFEYLLRAWEMVRDLTLKSTAPMLVYEEGSLVKRSIRDLYNKDIDEVIVAGDAAYHDAKEFMRMLMPSHAKNVKPFKDGQPLFTRHGIESQLDAMFSPIVQLKSGGYIVLNQAEALVAIDVNSGRATREHHIEDTALKTNLEAAEEIARQLRLRDLAGLIVIDFIDMDEKRNNRAVERRLKECLKNDRARIQVGRISHFGLLEMSRQRIRTSVLESSTDKCPHCGGTGHVRSVSSVALQCLRMLEEALLRGATHNLIVRTRADIALYVLNQKRAHLRELESRFQITILVSADPTISGQLPFVIEKGEQVHSLEQARALATQPTSIPILDHEAEEVEEPEEIEEEEEIETEQAELAPGIAGEPGEAGPETGRRRRRRRRGRRGEGRETAPLTSETMAEHTIAHEDHEDGEEEVRGGPPREHARVQMPGENGEMRRRRRRGRRGGRRSRRPEGEASISAPEPDFSPIEPEVAHAVADFGGPAIGEPETGEPWRETRPVTEAERGEPREAAERHYPAPTEVRAAEPEPRVGEPELPRRRSTVREPAPFLVEGALPSSVLAPKPLETVEPIEPAAPPAQSFEPSPPSEPAKPRRTGWWARRLMGGDKE